MRLIQKLERWVWYGGAALAMIAGMINAVGFLSAGRHAVTHQTGTTTEMALAIAQLDFAGAAHYAILIFSYVAGAALSGYIVQHKALKLGRRYGVVLAIESALLFVSAYLMRTYHTDNAGWYGIYVTALACGLQNAMASTYSGTLLRTTHLTGMFTDIGVSFGHWLRRIPVDKTRLKLSFLITTSFCAGGAIGGWLFYYLATATLYIPATLTGGVAIAYATYSHWKKPKEKIEQQIIQTAQWIKRAGRRSKRR